MRTSRLETSAGSSAYTTDPFRKSAGIILSIPPASNRFRTFEHATDSGKNKSRAHMIVQSSAATSTLARRQPSPRLTCLASSRVGGTIVLDGIDFGYNSRGDANA